MTNADDLQLPRDPGQMGASLRDAFRWARDVERASSPAPFPDDAQIATLADAGADADDETRLAVVEQLLGSEDGARTIAFLVAARASTSACGDHFTAAEARTPLGFAGAAQFARPTPAFSRLKPLLLAASLMLVAGTSWYVYTLPSAGDEVRAAGSAVELFEVPNQRTESPITLRWKPLRADDRYAIEVLDVNDAPVYSIETNGTQLVIPSATLKPGAYRWYVRAKGTDGREIRSRVQAFTVS
jgi:hypothetical protein